MTKPCESVVRFEYRKAKGEYVYRCTHCDDIYGHGPFVIVVFVDEVEHLLMADTKSECRCSFHDVPRFYRSVEQVSDELNLLAKRRDELRSIAFLKIQEVPVVVGVRH